MPLVSGGGRSGTYNSLPGVYGGYLTPASSTPAPDPDSSRLVVPPDAPLNLPFTETFTDVDGAGWPAVWTTLTTSGTGTATIQSNTGQMTVGGTGLNIQRAYLSAMPALVDTDVTVSALIPATGAGWLLVVVGSDNGLGFNNFFPTLGYACQVNYDGASGGTLGLYRCPTTGASDAFVSAKAMAAGTRQYIRVQRLGSVVRCKVWAASGTEPATWDLTYTDPAPIATAGKLLLSLASDTGARTTTWDDLTVSVAAETSAAAGSITLGGSATATVASSSTTGSISLGGTGTATAPVTTAGSITLSGTTTARAAVTASGTVTLGGTASAAAVTTAAGSITLGGSVTARAAATATGGITLGGSATPAGAAPTPATASGSITLGSSSTARAAVTATGGIVLGGSVTAGPDLYHPHVHVTSVITTAPGTATLTGDGAQTAALVPADGSSGGFGTGPFGTMPFGGGAEFLGAPTPTSAVITSGNPATATLTTTVGTATLTSNGASSAVVAEALTRAELQLV